MKTVIKLNIRLNELELTEWQTNVKHQGDKLLWKLILQTNVINVHVKLPHQGYMMGKHNKLMSQWGHLLCQIHNLTSHYL